VRTSPYPVRLARALCVVSVLALAACGGGGSTGTAGIPNPGSNAICDSNAQSLQLARPFQGQTGVSSGTNTIEIVSSTDQDQLHASFQQFDLILRDNFGNQIVTGPLTLVADTGGPHPYTNDFYYSGSLQGGLIGGDFYTVYLNAPNTNCTPGQVGTFST
jgi:hypothetical protein